MQWKTVVAAAVLAGCRLADAADADTNADPGHEALTAAVSEIEATVTMPSRAGALQDYGRWYAVGEGSNAGYVIGVYRRGAGGKVALVAYKALPAILDGGCSVVTVRYSLREHRIESADCNGVA